MSILLLTIGLVLLALPSALGGLGSRLAPAEWCRSVRVCLWVGRFAVHAALLFAAFPLVVGLSGSPEAAHACHESVMAGLPVPPQAGWLALVAFLASAGRSAVTRRRNAEALRRLRAEPWLGRHRDDDGVDVVTLPCAERVAYAVPGGLGQQDQIVVSDGLLAALDDDEAEAVLRHERAHLRHRHHDALTLARDIEARLGWFAPARSSVAALRLAVERWADEEAGSGSHAARPAVRRALVKTVVLAVGPVPTFTDACTIAARLDALATTPPAPSVPVRVAATGPMLGLCALVMSAVVSCALFAHHGMDELVRHCPF